MGDPFCFRINPNVFIIYEDHKADLVHPHGIPTDANSYVFELQDCLSHFSTWCPCSPSYDLFSTNLDFTPDPISETQIVNGQGGIYCATFDTPGLKTISFFIDKYLYNIPGLEVWQNNNPTIATKTINISEPFQTAYNSASVWGPDLSGSLPFYTIGHGSSINYRTFTLNAPPFVIVKGGFIGAGDFGYTSNPIIGITEVLAENGLHLEAESEIVLGPNFFAYEGCTFTASVKNCYALLIPRPSSVDSIITNDITKDSSKFSNVSIKDQNLFKNIARNINESFKAYPNPTSGKIVIEVNLSSEKQAEVVIQDILGNNIRKLVSGNVKESKMEIDLCAFDIKPSVYNIMLITKDEKINQKIVFIK